MALYGGGGTPEQRLPGRHRCGEIKATRFCGTRHLEAHPESASPSTPQADLHSACLELAASHAPSTKLEATLRRANGWTLGRPSTRAARKVRQGHQTPPCQPCGRPLAFSPMSFPPMAPGLSHPEPQRSRAAPSAAMHAGEASAAMHGRAGEACRPRPTSPSWQRSAQAAPPLAHPQRSLHPEAAATPHPPEGRCRSQVAPPAPRAWAAAPVGACPLECAPSSVRQIWIRSSRSEPHLRA
eukprot:CAMPEP_0181236528 /NCGR_PEP_ID=MMETSP1096-20121128/38234_1 /TAXON_ID=156174 ORGANISM="Chrysochromulina ericina, Strain CCMP281" /NCGR_SAMPLE_ID=MMETSP1096 /ASSEMBLY_ACC=CAM_ASM_000453 /LENGTH=239 /DNA_ID=CAMNT_0023331735 /DNA_START=573 /DNA_END=1288 /DNA_ORIENTATION=-